MASNDSDRAKRGCAVLKLDLRLHRERSFDFNGAILNGRATESSIVPPHSTRIVIKTFVL
jgi:hypothetical protein